MLLGPSYWRFIHYFAGNSPFCREYLKTMPPIVLCSDCSGEWFDPADTDDLLEWSVALHNKINTKHGRLYKWTVENCLNAHLRSCDKCSPPYDPSFPWIFIHTIAAIDNPATLRFLNIFNNLYPCSKCKYTFFTDNPQSEESVLDWTIRHHKRLDPKFEYVVPGAPSPCLSCRGGTILTPPSGSS
jgi:hypothetical protein